MKNFFIKIGESVKAHKGRTVAIAVIAFVLVCVIVSLCLLNALLFNRFATGIVPTEAELSVITENPEFQYKRVVIIGVDGVGDFFSKISTPNFDKMFSQKTVGGTVINAAITYRGVAVYPTMSCENWMSMFHGVRPAYHGFLFGNTDRRAENGEKTDPEKYPSFIKQYLDANPAGRVLSVCTWHGVNNGVIENDDRIIKYNSCVDDIYEYLSDLSVMSRYDEFEAHIKSAPIADIPIVGEPSLKDYLKTRVSLNGWADETAEMRDAVTVQRVIDETVSDPDKYAIAYMNLDQVDHAGHAFGYGKPGYVNAVSRVDQLIGRLYKAYEQHGMLEDTLFILCTDHGHRLSAGKSNGKNTSLEVNVTFAIAGKTVKQGTPGKYVNTDLAPIVCFALGVKGANRWQGKVPYNMFKTL